jgi:peptidyl-prolyl cis-trans isomerase A (cyclophilin A)
MLQRRLVPLAAIVLAACSSAPPTAKQESAAAPPRTEAAPATYKVKLETSKGDVVIEVTREWAPRGADHFYALVKTGFYDGARFFRVLPRFVVQFGIAADSKTNRLWSSSMLPDDPVRVSNRRGTVTFATAGPNTRTTQIFINYGDNARLDKDGFSPFGKVVEGMEVAESFYNSYGEMAPRGQGPDSELMEAQGNAYLESKFPRLDYIKKAAIQ